MAILCHLNLYYLSAIFKRKEINKEQKKYQKLQNIQWQKLYNFIQDLFHLRMKIFRQHKIILCEYNLLIHYNF